MNLDLQKISSTDKISTDAVENKFSLKKKNH